MVSAYVEQATHDGEETSSLLIAKMSRAHV